MHSDNLEEFSELRTLCLAASAAGAHNQKIVEECTHAFIDAQADLMLLYEALLQSYLFAGFPAALEALSTFRSAVNQRQATFVSPMPESYDVSLFRHRGEQTCRTIYTGVYDQMRERLGQITPQLDEWMIVEGYGKTLSRPGLNIMWRELVNVAILGTCGWERQLYSHIRGAMNVGATAENCRQALESVLRLKNEEVFSNAIRVLNRVQQSATEQQGDIDERTADSTPGTVQ